MHDGATALDALADVASLHVRRRAGARRRTPRRARRRAVHRPDVVITPEVLEELRRSIPLAPLHQPYNLAAIEAVSNGCPTCRRSPASTPASIATSPPSPNWCRCRARSRDAGVQRYGFHGLSYEYIASVPAAGRARDRRRPRHRRAPGQRREPVRHAKTARASTARSASPRSTGSAWARGRARSIPASSCICFRAWDSRAKEVETILYKKSGLLGISGISNDMRDLLGSAEPDARLAVDYFVYRAAKEIGALAAVLGGIDGLVFTAGIGENSAEIRRRICEASAWLGIELDARRERPQGPADLHAGQQGVGLGDPDQRRTDDRPAHRAAAGLDRGARITTRRRTIMAATSATNPSERDSLAAWQGFQHRPLAEGDQRPRLHPAELQPYDGDETFLAGRDRAHARRSGTR